MTAPSTTTIDLSLLPAPAVVEPLDYETILASLLADFIARNAEYSALLESDPAYKILEAAAYRELLLRQRINDAAHAFMLAYATGSDLDHIGAWPYSVTRALIDAGDSSAYPPRPAVYESDTAFRARIQLAPEGWSTAGARGAYQFHALSASPDVRDVDVTAPTFRRVTPGDPVPWNAIILVPDYDAGLADPLPGDVVVTVLSTDASGVASPDLLATVQQALADEDVRPLTDRPRVRSASIATYSIIAVLHVDDGPDPETLRQAAEAAAIQFGEDNHRIGRSIYMTGLHAALHQPGVRFVQLLAPGITQDLNVGPNVAAYCASVTVTVAGVAP
jgi:phage-related baseplate assembly protein